MDGLEAVAVCDLDETTRFAREQGYVWARGLLPVEAVAALGARVDAAWAEAPGDRLALQRAVLPLPELERFRRDQGVLRVLEAILGPCEAGQGDVVRYVLPGDPPTPPHQDGSYVGTARLLWLVWVPLGECPVKAGPLAVWPGSHALGLLPHDAQGLARESASSARWAASGLAPGDALFVSSLTVHKALPNSSGWPRRSVDCRYRACL